MTLESIANEMSLIGPRIGRAIVMKMTQAHDFSNAQIFTILALYEEGKTRITDLACLLRVSAPTMTGIVSRLEQGGHLQRVHDTKDRRVVYATLTPKGLALAKRMRAVAQKRWMEILSHVPPEEARAFVNSMKKISIYV